MKKQYKLSISLLLIGVVIGYSFTFLNSKKENKHQYEQVKNQTWTCSMHPQVRRQEAGQCPICGMDLTPLTTNSQDAHSPIIKMSATAMKLANIQTSVVTKESPSKKTHLNGKIQANEGHINAQTAHFAGRIERLLINLTGEYVKKGQVIAYIYSPELVTAQEELFEALTIKQTHPDLYRASKEKLKNWKLSNQQINKIIHSGVPTKKFPVLANWSGVVLTRNVTVGDHVTEGTPLFELADLSKLWVLFDIYEKDLASIKKGNNVQFTIQSFPNEEFEGEISFIDPVINPTTRVAKARLEIDNINRKFKPEMFVRGLVKSNSRDKKAIITIPKSAVLWTGKRSIVYVKKETKTGVGFELRKITLGTLLGESYLVTNGLLEGEEIATNGAFTIDASAQLAGKPSMMNTTHTVRLNDKANFQLNSLVTAYMALKNSLVKSDLNNSLSKTLTYQTVLKAIEPTLFEENETLWVKKSKGIQQTLLLMQQAKNLKIIRAYFLDLSNQMVFLAKTFHPTQQDLYIQHCPMANSNKGADWLSFEKEIRNPYFGDEMLECGNAVKIK